MATVGDGGAGGAEEPVLRVLGVQLKNEDATTPASRDRNLAAAAAALRAHPGNHIYLLCELSAVGYGGPAWLAAVPGLAEEAESGPSFMAMSPVARELGAFVVYGFPRKVGPAATTIAQAVVGPTGELVGVYDKLHLCGFGDCSERGVFTPGEQLLTFEAQYGYKVGVLICYDLRHPEVWSALADVCGVDVVLHPACFPNDGSFATWHPFVKTRAVEHQLYVLSVSRAHPHFGHSIAVGPRPPSADAAPTLGTGPGVLPLTVSRTELAEARREFPFRADRRRDYTELAQRWAGGGGAG